MSIPFRADLLDENMKVLRKDYPFNYSYGLDGSDPNALMKNILNWINHGLSMPPPKNPNFKEEWLIPKDFKYVRFKDNTGVEHIREVRKNVRVDHE